MSSNIVSSKLKVIIGKHYGTEVLVTHPNGKTYTINVWLPIGSPSDAELIDYNIDRAGWEANVEVDNGWGGHEPVQRLFPCDNHYQSAFELAIAERIVSALDGMVWDD